MPEMKFKEIANHYGMLKAFQVDEKFYWGLDGPEQEIPEYLYRALERFANGKVESNR